MSEYHDTTEVIDQPQPTQTGQAVGSLALATVERPDTRQPNVLAPQGGEAATRYHKPGRKSMDPLTAYLNKIGKIPLLTASDERELAQTIEAGVAARQAIDDGSTSRSDKEAVRAGIAAKEHFIKANLRLVVSIAKRYPLPEGMDLLDLSQEGNLGLEHAVDKFDWRRGFKFSTYATDWIKQSIGRALDQKGSLIRLQGDNPAKLRAELKQVNGESELLNAKYAGLYKLATTTSLDMQVGQEGEATLNDFIASADPSPEEMVINRVKEDLVGELLSGLDPRTRCAVENRFGLVDGERKSFREIGEQLGVTAEAARRLINRAVAGIRKDIGPDATIEDFLG